LFIAILSVLYGNVEAALAEVYDNHLDTIEQLVTLSGNAGLDAVSFDHLAKLVSDLEDELKGELSELSWTSFSGFNQTFNTLVGNAYNNVIQATGNPLAEAFDALGIDGDVLIQMKDNLEAYIDPSHKAAFNVAVGYLRNDVELENNSGGSSLTAKLIVLGKEFPSRLLVWEKVAQVSGTDNTVSSDGQITLAGTGTGEATVKASLVGWDLKLFEGNVTLNNPSSGGSIGGGGAPGGDQQPEPQVPDVEEIIEEVGGKIDEVTSGIGQIKIDENADPSQVAGNVEKAVQEAVATARAALAQASTVKATVTSEAGVAKTVIDESVVGEQIAAIQKLAEEMSKKLAEVQAAANAKLAQLAEQADSALAEIAVPKLKLELVIDLGDVEEDQAEAVISHAVIEAVKATGISYLTINVNGAKVSLSPSDLNTGVNIQINTSRNRFVKRDVTVASVQAAATDVSYIRTKPAAEAYDIKVIVDGEEVRSFQEPVLIGIPVTNVAAYDKDLLTIVSVDGDDQYTYFTGSYNEETGHVESSVYSLTGKPYTVVETVVNFNDLAPVQSWAGREIAVVAGKGIINGKQAGIYDPTASVTRAEFAKMIVLAYNLFEADAVENFTDVNDSDWFKPYVASAVKHGLINGRGDGRFDPLAPITRAEMATIAARALENLAGATAVSNVDGALSRFSDAGDIVSSLRAGTALAARYGIVVGSDGKFNPNGESTRAAAAVVIYRLINVN